jgi:hypothetical protein
VQIKYDFVRFEVFMAVTMKNTIFWGVMPHGSCKNRRFGGTYCYPHDGGICSSETVVHTIATQHHTPEDAITLNVILFKLGWSLFTMILWLFEQPGTEFRACVDYS